MYGSRWVNRLRFKRHGENGVWANKFMAGRINKHGLSDYIPADVRRTVRRDCGFGCVVCGLAIAQYEHFDPPFEDAMAHRAKGIALLCGACHDKKSRGFWSTDKVAEARRDPRTFKRGYAHDAFDPRPPFTLWIGSSYFKDVRTIVRTVEGEDWFRIDEPEAATGPCRYQSPSPI